MHCHPGTAAPTGSTPRQPLCHKTQSLYTESAMKRFALCFTVLLFSMVAIRPASAADLTLKLKDASGVTAVGAILRWDADGNHRQLIDPKAKIDAPRLDAKAVEGEDGCWVFADLPSGKYNLVVMGKDRLRIEGFCYPPVLEFDQFLARDAKVEAENRKKIVELVSKSLHYENKVEPLHLSGDDKAIRVLVMLIRDKPTSYENDSPGAATIRHEVWQYTWRYGGWAKEKRTKVLDRLMLHRDDLRKWIWLWTPELGGINVTDQPLEIEFDMSEKAQQLLKGLRPY